MRIVDDFVPVFDVSDAVTTVVRADVATTWDALMEVDVIEVAQAVLQGELPQRPPEPRRLRDHAGLAKAEGAR